MREFKTENGYTRAGRTEKQRVNNEATQRLATLLAGRTNGVGGVPSTKGQSHGRSWNHSGPVLQKLKAQGKHTYSTLSSPSSASSWLESELGNWPAGIEASVMKSGTVGDKE